MKHPYFIPTALLLAATAAQAQNVGIGTAAPNAAAALDITATNKGLLIPRLDSATRVGIATPPTGLMVFQIGSTSPRTRTGFYYYAGGAWLFLPDKARSGDNLGSGVATTDVALTEHQLRLRAATDSYHVLQYSSAYDGPLLYGYGGGTLGYTSNGTDVLPVIAWKRNGVASVGVAGTNTGTGPDLAFGGNGTGEGIGSPRSNGNPNRYGLDFYTGFVKRLSIANSGNIGIGTTGPDRPLAIQAPSGSTELLSLKDNTGATKFHYNLDGGGLNLAESSVADYRLYVQAGGNVGLGTNAPSQRLDVAGTARLRGLTTAGYVVAAADGTLSSVAIPTAAAPAWSLTGNAGTDPATNFIGTTDATDFVVRTNNAEVARFTQNGSIYTAGQTVAVGGGAGAAQAANNGNLNVFVGFSAGGQNPGRNNAITGGFAGRNSTGSNNTLLGAEAAQQLGMGDGNTIVGNNALRVATSGSGNVALGNYTGSVLASGSNNTFVGAGADAATTNTTLTNATAIGAGAMVAANNALVLGGTGSNAVSVGIGNTAPSSTLQVSGSFAVGVVNGVAGGASSPGTALNKAGYYGLNPGSSGPYYQLPDPGTCVGRVYYLRNNSNSTGVILTTAAGMFFDGGSASGGTTYGLAASGTSKTVTAISDGVNWTVIKSGS